MRKNLTKILTFCLAISTLAFAFLWMEEKNSGEDVKELARAAAVDAYERFTEYRSYISAGVFVCDPGHESGV